MSSERQRAKEGGQRRAAATGEGADERRQREEARREGHEGEQDARACCHCQSSGPRLSTKPSLRRAENTAAAGQSSSLLEERRQPRERDVQAGLGRELELGRPEGVRVAVRVAELGGGGRGEHRRVSFRGLLEGSEIERKRQTMKWARTTGNSGFLRLNIVRAGRRELAGGRAGGGGGASSEGARVRWRVVLRARKSEIVGSEVACSLCSSCRASGQSSLEGLGQGNDGRVVELEGDHIA